MQELTINDLEVLKTENESKKAIICLHGYGANNRDLAPISDFLKPSVSNAVWYFPNAPLKLDFSPFYDSRAWFHIDPNRMIPHLQTGEVESLFPSGLPAGMDLACNKIAGLIKSIESQYEEIVIGGFSQGSMLACQLAFSKVSPKINKLYILSGSLVSIDVWESLIMNTNLNIFQSHGISDPVLPISLAKKLDELFRQNNQKTKLHEFDGGHEIPPHILNSLGEFINE